MSRSLNKATLIGNLGQDPEIRTTSSGRCVTHLSLATERQWTDSQGEPQKRTEWHRIIAWDKLAEIAEQYLAKGERIYVEGEIQYRSYEDNEGVTRYVTEINARELIMLGGREAPAPEQPAPAPSTPRRTAARRGRKTSPEGVQVPPLEDDDLPF